METININKMANMLGTTDNVYKHLSKEDLQEELEFFVNLLKSPNATQEQINDIKYEIEQIKKVGIFS